MKGLAILPFRLVKLVVGIAWFLLRVLLVAVGTGMIFWSNLPWSGLRTVLAVAFVIFGIWALWLTRRTRGVPSFAVVAALLGAWWISVKPTHDRQWAPDVAVLPQAKIDGDRVVLEGVRSFDYRSVKDFTPHYDTREVQLSHLQAVDLFLSFSGDPGPMAHTFVSFDFDNAPPVCISIEARRAMGDHYRPLASCFKQFELIYIIGDERDIVRLRTNYRKENVYMFRVRMKPENLRLFFLEYLAHVNRIVDHPEFYNLLKNNCTINIHRLLAEVRGPAPWDWAMLVNGWSARLAYKRGGVDTSMSYDDLMNASLINGSAQDADQAPDFSARIRAGRPGM